MPRDYTETGVVSTGKVHELKAAKFGRRTYLLIDNTSASDVKFDFGVAPSDYNGITLSAGIRYERNEGVPSSTVFIRGTGAADQIIQLSQGFEE